MRGDRRSAAREENRWRGASIHGIDSFARRLYPRVAILIHLQTAPLAAESKPAFLRFLLGFGPRGCFLRLPIQRRSSTFLRTSRVVNVIPGRIEEDGFHRDELQFRRVGDQIGQVDDAFGWIFVQPFDHWRRSGSRILLRCFAFEVFEFDQGAVLKDRTVQEVLERSRLGRVDFKLRYPFGCRLGGWRR